MEAQRNPRAAIRLTALAAGVLLTLAMAVVTVGRWLAPRAEAPAIDAVAVSWADAEPAVDEPATCPPSFELPDGLAEESPVLAADDGLAPFAEPYPDTGSIEFVESGPDDFAEIDVVETEGEVLEFETFPADETIEDDTFAAAPTDDVFGFGGAWPTPPVDDFEATYDEVAETDSSVEEADGHAAPLLAAPAPTIPAPTVARAPIAPVVAAPAPAIHELAEELPPPPPRVAVAAVERAPADEVDAYTPAVAGLDVRLRAEVREGFDLGRAGALFAARAKFIGVMRKIALAKDAAEGTTRHARALADGLRALDEADDFVPRGDALEAELDTRAIAASHVTPVVRKGETNVAPHAAVAVYSRYAAQRLGEAVAGAQAGSMACYGLGKTYARLEAQSDDPHAGRKSGVMHRAALAAHPANYMAANELGVRLASLGHYEQARGVLLQAVTHNAPISKIHENLAAVEQTLGNAGGVLVAQANAEAIARHELATGELSRRSGVQWVSPQAFQTPGAAPTTPAPAPAAPTAGATPEPGGWKNTFERLKRATGWSETAPVAAAPAPAPVVPPLPYAGPPSVARSPQRVVR